MRNSILNHDLRSLIYDLPKSGDSSAQRCYAVNVQNAHFFQDFERQSSAQRCYAVNVLNAQFFQDFER
jgi:hypothetical protein